MLKAIEETLMTRFCEDTEAKPVEHSYALGDGMARVTLQLNRKSEKVFRYWIGISRVDRDVLATLSCQSEHCPKRHEMLRKWHAHESGLPIRIPKPQQAVFFSVLAREEVIDTPHGRFFAREARFPHTVVCPENLHDPIRISINGWDLFNEEGYVCGGMQGGTPMFQTLSQVRNWLEAQAQSIRLSLEKTEPAYVS